MSKEVYISEARKCDLCTKEARWDGKTQMGPWANMCDDHFASHGVGLGTGFGQRLIVGTKPVMKDADISRAIESGEMTYEDFEDLIGDRDPAEFF